MQVIRNAESKQAFFDWLSIGNANKYSPSRVVSCFEKISEYAINKKICYTDFWCITQPGDFEHIYTKILDEILLSTLDRSIYKIFTVVGQLYSKFLRDNLFSNVGTDADGEGMHISVTPLSESTDNQEVVQSEKLIGKQARHDINPEALIVWLTTQPNANGTLYLERVVRQYIWALRYAPAKLILATVDNRNVFSCQTVEELNSLWEVFKSAPNYKDVNQRASGQFSAGLSCLSRYLECLSEGQENTPAPKPSSKPLPIAIQPNQNTPTSNSAMYVDFNQPELYAKTLPVFCTINGQAVIMKKLNWSQLLISITERLIADGNPHLAELDKRPVYGSKVFFLPRKPDIGTSALLSNGKWISTNYNPQTTVIIIGNLCHHCDVGLETISISYVPKNVASERSAERLMSGGNTDAPALATTGSVFETEVLTAVSYVLSAHFPNGFRADSPIELMRFRSYAADDATDRIPLIEEDLKKAISLCGTLFEGKVYVVGKETESRLKKEIDAEVISGAEVIFYASFYARHESWLFPGSVISEVMLKEMLKTLFPAYQHKINYFSTKNNVAELPIIKSEILRVWNGDILLNYEQVSARLPYIPLDKIKHALAMNDDFIWNSPEIYTHIGMVDISAEERADIEDYVAAACRKVGYVSMSEVPLGNIAEHNNELTITAIHTAVFVIVLSDRFERRDKIITRKGDTLDALTIMIDYCRSIDKCSFQDLIDLERNLTGDAYPWIALEAGCTVLVRIAEDAFVAEKYVHFDVDGIDATLDLFVTGEYLPLKSVTTFATFPHCGQVWNLFLLESYCRRFSRRFRFDGLTMNSRNAGAIIRKSCGLAYAEIMAGAVAASGVVLKKTEVVEFLRSHGYIGRRFYARTGELIEQAKTLRERRN